MIKQDIPKCGELRSLEFRVANPHAPDAAASTASHPAFVAIMIRSLCGVRWGHSAGDLGQKERRIFFQKGR